MITRRTFGRSALAAAVLSSRAWGAARRRGEGPTVTHGTMSGDLDGAGGTAVVWARADRPARMIVEWSTDESFRGANQVVGLAGTPENDFTAKTALAGLPTGADVFYRVKFSDLGDPGTFGPPVVGRFRTPRPDSLTLVWGGDVCGQGWGIDPGRGGMAIFDAMRAVRPDVFLHSGDHIYADNPLVESVPLDDGSTWKNLLVPEKLAVAQDLDEFRGNFRYNLLDVPYRAFLAEVPMLAQWDDHETANNWYPGEVLSDPRYTDRDASALAARAKRAFREYVPIHPGRSRIERSFAYGDLVEIFLLDQRSDRGSNSANRQTTLDASSQLIGPTQLGWLKRRLEASRAVWKIIAADLPLGEVVADGPGQFENGANGDPGAPSGRELEYADLFRFMKARKIRNVHWLTADVHHAAAIHFDPDRAAFADFDPFWEFIAGPLHAGTFGQNPLDGTFGPELRYRSVPEGMKPNRPPSEGLQFFGQVRATREALSVSLHRRDGMRMFAVEIPAIDS